VVLVDCIWLSKFHDLHNYRVVLCYKKTLLICIFWFIASTVLFVSLPAEFAVEVSFLKPYCSGTDMLL